MKVAQRARLFASLALAAASTSAGNVDAAHAFDLDAKMPPKLSVIFTMSWFGITGNDPQGAGGDGTYANWHASFPACGLTNDPATCAPFADAGAERAIASKRRPLAGIYSSSAKTGESKRRIDLMLATLRRPCSDGSRIDAWGIQLDSVQLTSRYPQNKQSETWDIAYRALLGFLERADAAKLTGAVAATIDSTVYWHFGDSYGLSTQDTRKAALTRDLADMATIASQHPSSLKVNGLPVLAVYVDAALQTAAEWQTMLDDARSKSGTDFYAIATTLDTGYFAAFDAIAPWVNLGIWGNAQGATVQAKAADYAHKMHDGLVAALPNYPGRVVLGGVSPGFDDYTQDWGACTAREIPRDPAFLTGQFDTLDAMHASGKVKGLVLQTWDDWTEGTEIEPDVVEGTAKLVAMRHAIGGFYGEADDAAGDKALDALWTGFGKARSCCFEVDGGCPDAGAPPAVSVACPAGGGDGGVGVDDGGGVIGDDAGGPVTVRVDAGVDASAGNGDSGNGSSGGCGCKIAETSRDEMPLLLSAFIATLVAARRRRRRARRPRDATRPARPH